MMPSLGSQDAGSSIHTLPLFRSTSTARLEALYSDISRQKLSNPTSYYSNIEWWRKALELVVSSGLQSERSNRLVLTAGRHILDRVRVENVGKPVALGAVVTELRASKTLIHLTEFMKSQHSIYDTGWLPGRIVSYVVGKPLWWALEQVGVVGEQGFLGGGVNSSHKDTSWWGEYVFVSLVERAADEVLDKQAKKTGGVEDSLYSLESFMEEFGSVLNSERSLNEVEAMVLIKYLERDRKAIICDKEVVKFRIDDSSLPAQITVVDRGILELKNAVRNLHVQIDGLQLRIDECTRKASIALRQTRKTVALSHLRSRKQLEEILSKRLGYLNNLEATLLSVEAAAGDIEIMKSYESSTATLRAILAHPSLQKASIETTMNALAEANVDAKEVDEAIRFGADIATDVNSVMDDGELEKELEALVLDSTNEQPKKVETDEKTKKKLDAAAGVPTEIPIASKDLTEALIE